MSTRTIRLHCPAELAPGVLVHLDERQAHQLRHVLRRRSGDGVRLFNAQAGEWCAELQVERRSVSARVVAQVRAAMPEGGPTLALALLKRPKFELVLEKATELGVAAVQPLTTHHSVADRLNVARATLILEEAAEQCERLSLPALAPPAPLAAWLAARDAGVPLYAALERQAVPSLAAAAQGSGAGDLLIGPEGGFAADEQTCIAAQGGVVPVSLGPRVLRAETAAIVGLGVLALLRSD